MKRFLLLACLLLLASSAFAQTTYYVAATGGNDARSCTTAQTDTTPKLTIANAIGCLVGGDTLQIKVGTYLMTDATVISNLIPSGPNAAHPTIIRNFGTDAVVLRKQSASGSVALLTITNPRSYIKFLGNGTSYTRGSVSFTSKFDFDCNETCSSAINATDDTGSANVGLTFDGISWHNTSDGSGMFLGGNSHLITNSHCYDVGQSGGGNDDHCIYTSAHDTVIDGNLIERAVIGYGIHQYCSGCGFTIADNNTYSNNVFRSNTAAAILLADGDGAKVFNNISITDGIAGDAWGGIRITHENTSSSNLIYNNTVYGCTGTGIIIASGANNRAIGNIVFGCSGSNVITNGGSGPAPTSNLSVNPSFTNAAGNDFTLQMGSAAIGAGQNLSVSGGFTTDITGTERGGTWDIGAHQFTGGVTPPLLPLYDHFSYTLTSDLDTQNGGQSWDGAWAKQAGSAMTVQANPGGCGSGSVVRSTGTTGNTVYTRDFQPRGQGILSWYMRMSITNPSDTSGVFLTAGGVGAASVEFSSAGNIFIVEEGFSLPVLVAGYAAAGCYFIEIELDQVGHPNEFRVRANGGAWTAWYTVISGTFTPFDGFGLEDLAANAHTMYVDEINGADTSASLGTGLLTMGVGR